VTLEHKSLTSVKLLERHDLQAMLRQSCEAFFNEIGERMLLIGEEVVPTVHCSDRIDLLAIDQNGAAVVIEIKRGSNRLQLLQALSYAGTLSKWTAAQFIEQFRSFAQKSSQEVSDRLSEFLKVGATEGIGKDQRVILIAEAFDYEVLFTAEWLHERFGVDIRCFRLLLSSENESEFVTFTQVYPPLELTEFAISRRALPVAGSADQWSDWDAAFKSCANAEIVEFFRAELARGVDANLRSGGLRYKVGGRIAWWVSIRKTGAYVWQNGRFHDDVLIWTELLSNDCDISPVSDDSCLRFYLKSMASGKAFADAVASNPIVLSVAYPEDDAPPDEGLGQ
jgi:hypothetical protein